MIFLMPAHIALAQPKAELATLLNMDLATLMTVTVASKREEKISDAPGIITVITANEIHKYGARHLGDVINRLTNTQLIGSNVFPQNVNSIRGGALTHADNKTLLLFNGRPIREAHGGGINGDIYRAFPVSIIDHIEVIRGPGSVLYGTNAYSGVLNIVTKDSATMDGYQASVSYGSFNRKTAEFSGGWSYGDFEIAGGLNLIKSDGDDFILLDETGSSGSFPQLQQSSVQAAFQASWNEVTVNAVLGDDNTPNVGAPFIFAAKTGDLNTKRNFIDIGYEHNITGNWSASINGTYNWHNMQFPSVGKPVRSKSRGWLIEGTTHLELFEDFNITAGGTYDRLQGTILFGPAVHYDVYRLELYTQADYKPSDWLKLVAGLQWNRPEGLESDYSPRFAAIANLNNNWGVKILYGEAFRSAFGADAFISLPTFVGNPGLSPENIKTIDAQVFYESPRYQASLTVYDSKATDIHERETTMGISTTVNGGTINFRGIELEGKAQITESLSFMGSASWQENTKKNGPDNSTFTPNIMIKAGMSYESENGYTLSIFNSYFGKPTPVSDINPAVIERNKDADSYNLLTVNINVDVNRLIDWQNGPDIELSLYGDNLLNEDIFFPDINRQLSNTLPHHEGRGIYATIKVKY
jgi:outer membrane receptor for ferrienterochelin and colicin